ncbi:uncharacterized protein LOC129593758 [Paramacrobiotus metropolitanus]|uniref:uncharacterized protein LOC129593758 n=1 Tax=Paramacrobiotus metropolitanus TaxID=2943436 RepID=UPI0024464E9B|nr:uncharacterized protein LOC129593758 [Paramacrobiotus metropolitanus]
MKQFFVVISVVAVASASFIPKREQGNASPAAQYDAVLAGNAIGQQFLNMLAGFKQAPAPAPLNVVQTRELVQQRDLLTNLIASALGVEAATVESLMATLKKLMEFYTMAEPLIEAINFPGLFAGFLQAILNHDITQWLIYEVAPATLPPEAITSLNNVLGAYFGPRPPVARSAVDPEAVHNLLKSIQFPL